MTVQQAIFLPFRRALRAIYSTIGPAKDWSLWRTIVLGGASKAKVAVNYKTALGVPAYFRAVDILASQIASLPFSVYSRDADGNVNEAFTHPLYPLLNYRPSPLYDTFIFREVLVRQLLNGGDKYRGGNALVKIIRDGRGAVQELRLVTEAWEMFDSAQAGGIFYKIHGEERVYYPEDIIHLRINSYDGLYGNSPLEYHQDTLGRAIAEIQHGAGFYGNGAQVSGVLETDQPINKDQRDIIQESWNRQYAGPDNQGKTALLSHGIKYKPMGRGIEDADIGARRLTVQDISNITGVPTFLLANMENMTLNNAELLNRVFVQYTLRAWCKRIEAEFNSKLFNRREQGRLFVRFNLDGLLRGDTAARSAYYQTLYNIRALNPNEIRRLENMNPYPGGDEYGQPLASNSQENTMNNESDSDADNEV